MKFVTKELIENVKLLPSTAYQKRQRDINYLMELTTDNLLFSYYTEAGLNGRLNYKLTNVHWGWDGPLCQIRGAFTGHWLSAAARIFQETGDMCIKSKADYIVSEIARCQEANGGEWAFSIPEKYLFGIKNGQHFWAPQYVCHKTMMGLLDMYEFAGNELALEIICRSADWFTRFTDGISRDTMDMMMDIEETGGLMELWADLYAITKDPQHLELMRRYERPKLIEPLFNGKDVLTNIHANTTIPEIHGCARAYEVTGEDRYRQIVQNYWDFAVTKRGTYATGGQTNGEVWTSMQRQSARLSELNQEHCTVYNMIRLANYLFRWTGDVKYLDYIEQNIENGLFAQGFWEARCQDTACDPAIPDTGLVAYFLPLAGGSQKKWGSKTEDFWCCHCTLVQANARYREFIYYQSEQVLTVAQYMPSTLKSEFNGVPVTITQMESDLGGDCIAIHDISMEIKERPAYNQMTFSVAAEKPVRYTIKFRMPWWLKGKMEITVNGAQVPYIEKDGFALLEQEWNHDIIDIKLPKGITCWPLADEKDTVAFLDGPVLLAGLVAEERILYGDINDPTSMLHPHHERQWTQWMPTYKTVNQDFGFYFKPIKDIGKEFYTVYFPVRNNK
ncbi:MAG: glycoside hydrolase family 127 protein [Eubacteriales bacterium]|nr:glycoside hydrolase family 127 protein [Eubacteriales bacterium]